MWPAGALKKSSGRLRRDSINAAKVAEWIGRAEAEGAELTIFPELCIPGYPAEDLYLKRHFIAASQRAPCTWSITSTSPSLS